ncbi:MAG TPA: hypothetical protein VHK28_03155 [Candidatus Limnocylindria bacterium]|nr:hypothetical protein [Candidatus Limnocylindria bacterium]
MLDDDLVVGHHDLLHHQPQDLLLHREGWLNQLRLEARAEGTDRLRQTRRLVRLNELLADRLRPLVEAVPRRAQPLAAHRQLVQLQHPGLIGVDEALVLSPQCRLLPLNTLQFLLGIAQGWAIPRLLLAQVGHDELWLAEQGPDMLPDHRLDIALADGPQVAAPLRRLAAAPPRAFVAPAGHPGVPAQAPPTGAADEQAGQEILVARLARRALAIELQLPLGHSEGLHVNDGRPGDTDPLGGGAQAAPRVFGRPPVPLARFLRRILRPIIVVLAGVEAVGEDLVDSGGRPGHAPGAWRDALLGQAPSDGSHRQLVFDEPGEDLAHRRRLGLVDRAGAALAVAGQIGVAVGTGPGEEAAGTGGVQLATAATLLEGGPLEFSEQAMHLAHQALFGAGGRGTGDEDDRAAGPFQFLNNDVLVGIVAGQPVGGQDEHLREFPAEGGVTQPVEAGAIEAGTAGAIVDVAMLGRDRQTMRGGVGVQGGELAGNGALLLLLGRRDTGIEGGGRHGATSDDGEDGAAEGSAATIVLG